MVFILAETAAGYAIFKAKDKNLKNRKSIADDLDSVEKATSILRLKTFAKFENTADALDNISAIVEGKVSPKLASLLKELDDKSASLIVSDPKLGTSISQIPNISLEIVADSSTTDLYRAIRTHMSSLIPELAPSDLNQMTLGLSHSLARHKLKFSPDKIDTMIVQAIGLLDDLDKELNTYSMRVKEWFGWHFPEMGKIITDNLAYAKAIKAMGFRTGAAGTDFSEILPEDVASALQAAAEVSMGTEISQFDLENILLLVDQVISLSEYRAQLYNYLCSRMRAIAPNLTVIVGELVGARLIAHVGNLVNLAKQPASTIQILGAEKALFRALKTKHDTPKYGLIFHASLVGQASSKNKGKIARTTAAKAALSLRYDALVGVTTQSGDGDDAEMDQVEADGPTVGIKYREKIEHRLRILENKLDGTTPLRNGTKQQKFDFKTAPSYNPDTDVPMTEADLSPLLSRPSPEEKKEKKDKKGKEKKEKKEKDGKKEKKRSHEEMDGQEDKIENKIIDHTKLNDVDGKKVTKKEKSKDKKDRDEKSKKRKISEAEESVDKTTKDAELDNKALRKLEKKKAKQEARAAKKARKE